MSDAKHTPGPWRWEDAGNGRTFLSRPDDDDPDCGTIIVHALDDIDPDDARLIAASPKLLAALEAAMAFIDCHAADPDLTGEMVEAWSALADAKPREAIAEAKGDSP